MDSLILHHFDESPFAEKARLMLGFKRLAWLSVEIPMIMPKPDLTALTGGYRKTPVLQIGADVYCDTRLVALELERRFPQPSLFPEASRGLALMLSAWSDRSLFDPGAGLAMALNQQGIPAAVIADRKAFFNFMDFDQLDAQIPHLRSQFRAQAALLEQQLGDGRPFLLGTSAGLADLQAYAPMWMVRRHVPGSAALLDGLARLAEWESRIEAIGHGRRGTLSAAEAHAIARANRPQFDADRRSTESAFSIGATVEVAAADYGRDPVRGTLVRLDDAQIVVERSDPSCGRVHVHFPRTGFRIDTFKD